MKEISYSDNLFLLPKGLDEAGVVTTNGILKKDGKLVMGAGIAKYCRDVHKGIDTILGQKVAQNGNHAYYAGVYEDVNRQKKGLSPKVGVISMPTKNNWRDASDPELIRRSCKELVAIAEKEKLSNVYMPMPGCSNGGLNYETQVRPILQQELDDRFSICIPGGLEKSREQQAEANKTKARSEMAAQMAKDIQASEQPYSPFSPYPLPAELPF